MIIDIADLHTIGVQQGSAIYNNLAADTVTLTRKLQGTDPLAVGDDFTLTDNARTTKKTLFVGKVESITNSNAGGVPTQSINIINAVGLLDYIIYSETRNNPKYGYMERLGLTNADTGCVLPLDDLLDVPFSYASEEVNLGLSANTGLDAIDLIPSGQDSVLSIMQTLARYHPSVRATVDYNVATPLWRWSKRSSQYEYSYLVNYKRFTHGATSKGASDISITPRYDLQPPAVCLTGGVQHNIGGLPSTPYAYVHHVTEGELAGDDYSSAGSLGRGANRQRTILRGNKLPSTREYVDEVKKTLMDEPLSDETLAFWLRFQGLQPLKKYQANIKTGLTYVQVIPSDELYTPDPSLPPEEQDPDDKVPYNYQLPSDNPNNWLNASVLMEGSFPASVESRECVHGLRWCRAKIVQQMFLATAPPKVDDIDALLGIFNSRATVAIKDTSTGQISRVDRQIAWIELDCILINREKKSFYPIDNSLAENDPDYSTWTPELAAYPEYISVNQLKEYAQQYYDETRDLVYDGNITIKQPNMHPSDLMQRKLSISWDGNYYPPTPIQSISYDLFTRDMSLTLGSKSPLGISERVDRYRTTRATILEMASLRGNPWRAQSSIPTSVGADKALAPETISPQISPQVVPLANPRQDAPPFTVFREGGNVYFKGGKVATLNTDAEGNTLFVEVEDEDITDRYQENQTWYIEQIFLYQSRVYEVRLKYRNNE